MDLHNLKLQEGEKVIQTFLPESFIRRLVCLVGKDAALVVTDKRVMYRKNRFETTEINLSEIYDIRVQGKNLNILKKGDSVDYDYDANFETYEMDRPYISIGWLSRPKLVKYFIDGLVKDKKQ